MKILVVAAHPDDEVLGCGGTITRLSREGNEVAIAILGEGVTSRYDDREKADPALITVPYVTSTLANGASSYQQLNVGLDSSFLVRFGKAVVIQNDESGQISVLVTRVEI